MRNGITSGIRKAAKVLRAAGAQRVYLFGSRVAGKTHERSDVDLAVVGLPSEVFIRALCDAEDALGQPLDLVDLDEVSPFTDYLKEAGQLQLVE